MSIVKHIEITAESDESFEDAVAAGLKNAGKTVKGIRAAWVKDMQALVDDGEISTYRVNMKITFEVRD